MLSSSTLCDTLLRAMRLSLALLVLLLFACAPDKKNDGKAVVENMAQTLQNEVAGNMEVPERVQKNVNAGDNSWEMTFNETSAISRNGFTTRSYAIVIRNLSSSPQKFAATIRFLNREGLELRTKRTREIVVPPYAEEKIEDSLTMPDDTSARVAQTLADVEVLEWEEDDAGR